MSSSAKGKDGTGSGATATSLKEGDMEGTYQGDRHGLGVLENPSEEKIHQDSSDEVASGRAQESRVLAPNISVRRRPCRPLRLSLPRKMEVR